ncbi:hydrogenase [Chitinophaga flava]|uniref:Hydrogenase n=1 Tax=Chitinophaga flava TaxID=2259036 RepID=A0A365XTW2_9BACT|nr:hydrogenase [Chitinophaga flava]RBL89792.1 hydrogenase [Chitinophaga flava]
MVASAQPRQGNKLIFLGLVLFLIGLITGLFGHSMANPRMALSAHLEGVMNGIFLIVLGLIWEKMILSSTWLKIIYWLVVFGTFANLVAVLIAAITGAGKMMPIAGGQPGTPWVDGIISFLLISLSLAMVAACVIILIGMYKRLRIQ